MKSNNKVLRYGFALFSLASSFLLIFYAVSIYFGGTASAWLQIFAYVVGGYGLLNVYTLSWAWRSKSKAASQANLLIAACFLGIFIMDTLRSNATNPVGLVVICGLAAVLASNWLAVNLAARQ
ncbi:hypothetical protein [Pelobacter seleniigenes]|uniref:hypothetical protein n=1 Tax=Pelobacter seleniigenes TaxID=407188 RepID=UPI0004A74C5F|nr:hypothetical protein [Pelobacter seleniigenes]